jgi:hypothetical protein
MSTHLHFDLVGGIAGDMTVAALVDAGADWQELHGRLQASGLPLPELSLQREWRGGMAGARFHVAPEERPPARRWRDIRDMLRSATLPEWLRRSDPQIDHHCRTYLFTTMPITEIETGTKTSEGPVAGIANSLGVGSLKEKREEL